MALVALVALVTLPAAQALELSGVIRWNEAAGIAVTTKRLRC
jgi:hypothetical protein